MDKSSQNSRISRALFRPTNSFRRIYKPFIIGAIMLITVFIFLSWEILLVIPAGQAGVMFRALAGGTDLDNVYGEGIHVIFPWDEMYVYDLRVKELSEDLHVLAKNGLSVFVTISVRYFPNIKHLPKLHQQVGPDVGRRFVLPVVASAVREVIGQYTPELLYRTKKSVIQSEILDASTAEVSKTYIKIDDVLIRQVSLPPSINQAIEAKMEQQQAYQEYEFLINKAKQEATRKRHEALGIKAYQEAIAPSLSGPLLRWKGIQATMEIAKSDNQKVVLVGTPSQGIPLILNLESDLKEKETDRHDDTKAHKIKDGPKDAG